MTIPYVLRHFRDWESWFKYNTRITNLLYHQVFWCWWYLLRLVLAKLMSAILMNADCILWLFHLIYLFVYLYIIIWFLLFIHSFIHYSIFTIALASCLKMPYFHKQSLVSSVHISHSEGNLFSQHSFYKIYLEYLYTVWAWMHSLLQYFLFALKEIHDDHSSRKRRYKQNLGCKLTLCTMAEKGSGGLFTHNLPWVPLLREFPTSRLSPRPNTSCQGRWGKV